MASSVGPQASRPANDTGKPAPASPVEGQRGGPTEGQRKWLRRGLKQPGGKLPLFDEMGQKVSERTVRSCLERGWAEPWFDNPLKPGWMVCKLTDEGRKIAVA